MREVLQHFLATALVAPLEIIVLREQVDREQIPMDRVMAGWTDLVRRVIAAG